MFFKRRLFAKMRIWYYTAWFENNKQYFCLKSFINTYMYRFCERIFHKDMLPLHCLFWVIRYFEQFSISKHQHTIPTYGFLNCFFL